MPKAMIPLGQTVATPGALAHCEKHNVLPANLIARHIQGDWGDLGDEDTATNDEALASGGRLLSSYDTPGGKVWIITEWDRSVTTLLLPSEY